MTDREIPYPIIDLHSHVLPGVDDGARTMEEAVKLVSMAYEQGIRGVFVTPHYSGRRRAEDRTELKESLRAAVRERFPDFSVWFGRESFYHEGLVQELWDNGELFMEGSRYALVEFDPAASYETIFRGIRSMTGAGIFPILAHVERYRSLRAEERLLEVMKCGCLLQMNFDSLGGSAFSADVRWCRKQVSAGRIFAMGTDMHRLDFRPPDIERSLVWLIKHVEPGMLRRMLYENPMSVLEE